MLNPQTPLQLSPELVQHLFPFYIAFDPELKVTHFGRAVPKICRNVQVGAPLLEIFSVWRPKGKVTFQNYRQQSQATFLLDSVTTQIRMRGQMVSEPQQEVLIFIGSPWFTDIEALQKTDLQLKDFTVHDPIVDFLYMVQAKSLALQDAKQFSETVIKQRDELEQTNKELERASAAKSQFLANTSHELRTPLNGIIGMTTLLTKGQLSPQQKNCGEKILRSAKALLVVVNDVLDFSKIEAGKLTLEPVDFDLQQLMFDVAELFAVTAQSKGLDLVCSFEPGVPTMLHGDPGRIRQIVSNLIGNAVKFTDHGDVTLHISVEESVGDEVLLRFEIIDTGIGIDPKHQGSLFSAFSQVDGSMTRKHGGTGLGLAISKNLAGLMGGSTGLSSEVGKGSTFWFTGRLRRLGAPEEPTTVVPSLRGQRILVVDDSAASRKHLSGILSRSGAEAATAEDALTGLELARAAAAAGKPYEVVLLDARMPRLSGMDLLLIIAGDPALDSLRTVLLQSMDQEMNSEGLRDRVRYDAQLTKPLRAAQVLECLASLSGLPRQPSAAPAADWQANRPLQKPAACPLQGPSAPLTAAPVQIAQIARVESPPQVAAVPAQAVAAPAILKSAPKEPPGDAQVEKVRDRRVLVVDDHPVNQEVASQMVESMGYRVDIAGNGREAVTAHFTAPYDIILTDLQMPEMDGYEETKEIRAREGKSAHTPIIAMTAHAMSGDRSRALEIGLDDYLAKPIDFDKLAALLREWVPLDGDGKADSLRSEAPPEGVRQETNSDTGPPPIDRSVLDQLRRYQKPGAKDLVADVVNKFLTDLPARVEAVRQASMDGDPVSVTKPAHALKSSSAMVGAHHFSEICAQLEERCQTEALEQVADLLGAFHKECGRVCVALKALLSEGGGAPAITGPAKAAPMQEQRVS